MKLLVKQYVQPVNLIVCNFALLFHNNWTKPFKPSRCIKASFHIHENRINFPTTKGFRMEISIKRVYQYMLIFLNFYTVVPLWYDFHTAREPKSHPRGSRIWEGWKKL